jgi:hypothetical protein
MRFITLSALFLVASTTLAAPLDLPSGQEDTYSSLALRDGVADAGSAIGITARSDFDDENWLERRIRASKKIANKVARKERETAKNANLAKARQKGINQSNKSQGKKAAKTPDGVAAAHTAGMTAAHDKKQELRNAAQSKRLRMQAAGVQHRITTGLPDRTHRFTIPAGNGKPERTYTGKDVRKANFGSHIKSADRIVSGTLLPGTRFGKPFKNADHGDAGQSGTTKPIPGMVGGGHEHPLSGATSHQQMKNDHRNEPARIISQPTATGHQHMGVVAHDQARPSTHLHSDDHFKVNPITMAHPSPSFEIPHWM